MIPIGRFHHLAWLAVYYQQIASPAFLALTAEERWGALRAHVLGTSTTTGSTRIRALDRVGRMIQPHILQWLEAQRAAYTSYSRRRGEYLYDINTWETTSPGPDRYCARVVNMARLDSGRRLAVNAALQDECGPTRDDAFSNMEAAIERWVKLEDGRER